MFYKKVITFDLTDIEKKICTMKSCCASNAAFKNVKIAQKNNRLFLQFFFDQIVIFAKNKDF